MTQQLFITDADSHQQGSFCDTTSQIHYDNMAVREADAVIAAAAQRGDTIEDRREEKDVIVFADGQSVNAKMVSSRNNCTILGIDDLSFEYPAKSGPGN